MTTRNGINWPNLMAVDSLPATFKRSPSGGSLRMSDRVIIFDTTLRDGEQSCGCSMTVAEKLRMARKLVELQVDVLEAGFPIASEGDFEAVQKVGSEFSDVAVAALARCSTGDIERAARALETAKRPRIHTFIATSPIHLKHKLKMTEDQALEA